MRVGWLAVCILKHNQKVKRSDDGDLTEPGMLYCGNGWKQAKGKVWDDQAGSGWGTMWNSGGSTYGSQTVICAV